LFYVTLNILLQQGIGDQHGDAGLPIEESHDTAQTQQLAIPIQEQHSHFHLGVCDAGASGSSHYVEEEGAARPYYQCGHHQLPCQREDDNQASGWSQSFARIRQAGGRTTIPQGGQFHNRLNVPVEERGSNHGYHCGYGLQDRVTSTQQREQITENCCGTQELQQLSNETLRRRVVMSEIVQLALFLPVIVCLRFKDLL